MKRFHLHVQVSDLTKNIAFYSSLFNQAPTRTEPDYAKWMLADPPINFAISARGGPVGIDHLGFQVDRADELDALRDQAMQAGLTLQDEGETTCCYARSDKHWLTDPQGIAWEQFHTLENAPVYAKARASGNACCATGASPTAKSAAAGCC